MGAYDLHVAYFFSVAESVAGIRLLCGCARRTYEGVLPGGYDGAIASSGEFCSASAFTAAFYTTPVSFFVLRIHIHIAPPLSYFPFYTLLASTNIDMLTDPPCIVFSNHVLMLLFHAGTHSGNPRLPKFVHGVQADSMTPSTRTPS
jgi:hypothetical protein